VTAGFGDGLCVTAGFGDGLCATAGFGDGLCATAGFGDGLRVTAGFGGGFAEASAMRGSDGGRFRDPIRDTTERIVGGVPAVTRKALSAEPSRHPCP
jgi:hypothetical protein